MATRPPLPNDPEPKITFILGAEDRAGAEDLARYWDATVAGRPTDPRTLDLDLALVVHLLRHYHDVTQGHPDAPNLPLHAERCPSAPRRHRPPHPVTRVAIAWMGLLLLLFTINTFTSPRSWLLSTADDPDWIPWVSDGWLGPDALTARSLGTRPELFLSQIDKFADGA